MLETPTNQSYVEYHRVENCLYKNSHNSTMEASSLTAIPTRKPFVGLKVPLNYKEGSLFSRCPKQLERVKKIFILEQCRDRINNFRCTIN